jgi:hypothetical protein
VGKISQEKDFAMKERDDIVTSITETTPSGVNYLERDKTLSDGQLCGQNCPTEGVSSNFSVLSSFLSFISPSTKNNFPVLEEEREKENVIYNTRSMPRQVILDILLSLFLFY